MTCNATYCSIPEALLIHVVVAKLEQLKSRKNDVFNNKTVQIVINYIHKEQVME